MMGRNHRTMRMETMMIPRSYANMEFNFRIFSVGIICGLIAFGINLLGAYVLFSVAGLNTPSKITLAATEHYLAAFAVVFCISLFRRNVLQGVFAG